MVGEADVDGINAWRWQVAGRVNNVNSFTGVARCSGSMLDNALTRQKVVDLNCDLVRRALKMNVHVSCKYEWFDVRKRRTKTSVSSAKKLAATELVR